ncbi:MAG: RNA polymerase sigma factor SigZ [Woeseia sp.]
MGSTTDVETVWSEYGQGIKQFLNARLPHSADVDDLVQQVLIKTHEHISDVREPSKFRPWLYQVARNTLNDYYRRARPDASLPDILLPPEDDVEAYEEIRQELAQCIRPFISQLPEKYRDAVQAADLDNVPQTELAARLGLSHSAAKSRVQRGRAMLRELYQKCCALEIDARGNLSAYEPRDKECC